MKTLMSTDFFKVAPHPHVMDEGLTPSGILCLRESLGTSNSKPTVTGARQPEETSHPLLSLRQTLGKPESSKLIEEAGARPFASSQWEPVVIALSARMSQGLAWPKPVRRPMTLRPQR